MKRCWSSAVRVLVGVALWCTATPSASAQDNPWQLAVQASGAMDDWDYVTARTHLDALNAGWADHPATAWVQGEWLFHHGEYDAAVEALDAAVEGGAPERVAELRDLVADTRDVTADYATYVTADGLFEIRYDARRDAVLIPWAEATLEGAYYEIGYDIGYWPEPPIRVEIYPRSSTLARTSSLTEEAIQTSGTIALCKYNKLMFTSPRATARGYGWRDTLSHEYVHYAVAHLTQRDLPIWLHEALAKYLEGRWTGSRDMHLEPSREDLLGERIEAGTLITFEQMHPSMAYLPSPEDASTAYSQVFTIMEFVVQRRGPAAIRELLYRLKDGAELELAFEATFGEDFETFERTWMAWLAERPRVEVPGSFQEEIQLISDSGDGPDVDELAGVGSVEAREHLRLGELLRGRGHVDASIVEYEKAETLVGNANPILQNALARARLDLADPDGALNALEDVRGWHPDFYPLHLHHGEALLGLGRPREALDSLEAAVGINPFDPAVHHQLARAFEAVGSTELAARAREHATAVAR